MSTWPLSEVEALLHHHLENSFLAGREFADLETLNRDAITWCNKVNATHKRRLHAAPRELFAAEKPRLRPLPASC